MPTAATPFNPNRCCWIGLDWTSDSGSAQNRYVAMRRRVVLATVPPRATAHVTADARYVLWVNGTFAGRGPARCYPDRQSYDTYDLAPLLRPGENWVAAIVHQFGVPNAQYVHRGRTGLLIDGDVVATDFDWQVRAADWYAYTPYRLSVHLGFQEHVDARREPPGWRTGGGGDDGWHGPWYVGPPGAQPWTSFEPRGLRPMVEHVVAPLGVAWFGRMTEPVEHPNPAVAWARSAAEPEASPTEPPDQWLTLHARSVVAFDFGWCHSAYPRIEVRGAGGGETLDSVYDFGLPPAGERPRAAAGFGGDGEGVADRFTAAAGDAAWQPFMPRGYRLHVVTNRGPGPVQVRVTAARTHADVGDARPCPVDDPLLTRVWRTSATTLLAGMLDAFVDNNSREQAQWLGDLAVSGPAAFATFGDASLWRRGLRLAAQSQQPDGALNSIPPSEANFMCVADYSFHWLSSLWALYEATRDRDLLIELLPAAAKLLHDFVTPNLTADRLFVTPQGRWQFLDWSLLDHRPYSLTLNLVLLRALEAGVRVSAACGNADLAARFAESAHDLREAAERRFWSNEHDAWLDHVDPSPAVTSAFAKRLERHDRSPWMQRPPPGGSYFPCTVHSNALAASLKLGTPQQQAAALAFVRRAVTSPGQTFTNTHGPLWTAWVLLPLLEGGHRDDVIAAIRATYGKWLDQGATTWGEGNDASAQTHAQTWGACVNLVIARLAETV